MAAQNRTDLGAIFNQSASGLFLDNTTRAISPADLRAFVAAYLESSPNILEDTYLSYGVTATGTDTYAAVTNPTTSAYVSGQVFFIKFTNANTGAATININLHGAISILKNGSSELDAGDISADQVFILFYDGTNFQLIGGAGGSTGSLTIATWAFPADAFPTSANVLYIATADHGDIGDPDYVATGTWFIATSTPSGYGDFNYK